MFEWRTHSPSPCVWVAERGPFLGSGFGDQAIELGHVVLAQERVRLLERADPARRSFGTGQA
jgi:hypothetical protein